MQSPATSKLCRPVPVEARAADAPQCAHCVRLAAIERQINLLLVAAPVPLRTIKLIPIKAVGEILGLKDSAIHAKVASQELPAPVKLSARENPSRRSAARWVEAEIFAYAWALATKRATLFDPETGNGVATEFPTAITAATKTSSQKSRRAHRQPKLLEEAAR